MPAVRIFTARIVASAALKEELETLVATGCCYIKKVAEGEATIEFEYGSDSEGAAQSLLRNVASAPLIEASIKTRL